MTKIDSENSYQDVFDGLEDIRDFTFNVVKLGQHIRIDQKNDARDNYEKRQYETSSIFITPHFLENFDIRGYNDH